MSCISKTPEKKKIVQTVVCCWFQFREVCKMFNDSIKFVSLMVPKKEYIVVRTFAVSVPNMVLKFLSRKMVDQWRAAREI